MHYRDRTHSPEAIVWRQDISPSVIGGQEVARVRAAETSEGLLAGKEPLLQPGCQPTSDLPAACQVNVIRMGSSFVLFFLL